MKTVAVICEYNPFHNGHARQLRQMAAVGTTVCVMSGNYVQRGEPAICDKWTRARAAALCGGMYMLICAGDGAEDASECIALADAHLERMRRELERECAGIS